MKHADQFGALRARVESEVARPAAILVTSARAGDGKSATAACLAAGLATAGYRVLLIDASRSDRLSHVVGPRRLLASNPREAFEFVRSRAEGGEDVLNLTNAELAENLSADAIKAILPLLKESYDYILIDSAEYLASTPALLFASVVDGLLIAVRQGRAAIADDTELSRTLAASRVNVLGIVTVTSKVIREVRTLGRKDADYSVRIAGEHVVERTQTRPTSSVVHSG